MNTTNYPGMPIPWYRTRLFWGVVFSLLLAWSISFYFFAFHESVTTLSEFFGFALLAVGGGFFGVWGYELFGILGGFIGDVFSVLLMGFLIYKIFYKARVHIRYPLTFLILFLMGTLTAVTLLGSFA